MERDLNLDDTEFRLGLPGSESLPITIQGKTRVSSIGVASSLATKVEVVGWPPIRSYRRSCFHNDSKKDDDDDDDDDNESMNVMGMYVKVSMDGAPYLRKIDINGYKGYPSLFKALKEMFKLNIGEYYEREGYIGSEFVPTYEDKDGDWMLVGDVPWGMFMSSCKRLRIMRGSEAKRLACNI